MDASTGALREPRGHFAQGVTALLSIALAAIVLMQRAELRDAHARLAQSDVADVTSRDVAAGDDAGAAVVARVLARLELMHDVARWKWNERKPIDDPEREAALLKRIVAQATARGIGADQARAFFEDQFAAAKIIQRADFDEWTQAARGPFENVPDLATVQRPRIDAATEALLDALSAMQGADRRVGRDRAGALMLQRKGMSVAASTRFESPADPVRRALRAIADPPQ